MVIELAGPLVAAGNLVITQLNEARKPGQTTVQALMNYSAAIEHAIHALINETRTILIVGATDLGNDQTMSTLKSRISTYLGVHTVYDPLKDARVEAEQTLELLDAKAKAMLGMKDIGGKKRQALTDYRNAFNEVLEFISSLTTQLPPHGTGLLMQEMIDLREIAGLDHDHRLKRKAEVDQLVDAGLTELDEAFAGLTERLVRARHKVVAAFS